MITTARKIYHRLFKKQPLDRFAHIFSDRQWLRWIVTEVDKVKNQGTEALVLIGSGKLLLKVERSLERLFMNGKVPKIYVLDFNQNGKIKTLSAIKTNHFRTLIVACSTSNTEVTKALQLVMNEPNFRLSRFIYLIRPSLSNSPKGEHKFSTPIFEDGLFQAIYEDSLRKVNKKCEKEEAEEIYQFVLNTKDVKGAIAEFGSYEGHSGLIISEVARRLRMNKTVYLCDTFSQFPQEELAVDQFWSGAHPVDYEKVKELFKGYPNVKLVRGDFIDTVDTIDEKAFSFVYVDCDSYRAVKLVSEKIYPKLSSGGIICYEDYGHAPCLGARYAVDEYYEGKKDCFKFFSTRSGMQIVVKLS